MPGDKIGALTLDGGSGTIYATTDGGTLFQTTDGGDSWQTAPADLAYGAIVTDPSDRATSYAAAWANTAGIVKSVDHGQTWTAADNGIVSTVVTTLAFVPAGPATLYAGTLGNSALQEHGQREDLALGEHRARQCVSQHARRRAATSAHDLRRNPVERSLQERRRRPQLASGTDRLSREGPGESPGRRGRPAAPGHRRTSLPAGAVDASAPASS